MIISKETWGWVAFVFGFGAYVPLFIGGWLNPHEINLPTYFLWIWITALFVYSSWNQGFAGWRLPLGWMVGNITMTFLGWIQGGYAQTLGLAEGIAVFGIICTLAAWVAYGQKTGKYSSRILMWGSVATDFLSLYPLSKQYLGPNEMASFWTMFGWWLWLAAGVNLIVVEEFFRKPFCGRMIAAIEASLISLASLVYVTFAMYMIGS